VRTGTPSFLIFSAPPRSGKSISFGAYMTERPGGPTEIHSWIGTIFTEFRELELRLMMGKLGASLRDSVVGKLSAALARGASAEAKQDAHSINYETTSAHVRLQ
jgi:hypothetical protein